MVVGRMALLPAVALLLYRILVTYAMAVGWLRNTYRDGVIPSQKKFSAQFPDASGQFGADPASSDVVVLLIGARYNHPLGLLAPGARELGEFFGSMVKDLDAHSEEFGFLGMTSWISHSGRETKNELLDVGYFRTVEGLHRFAHSEYHRKAWDWWNKTVKEHSHLSIYHEVYHAPKGHWESIYVNSHESGFASTTHRYVDKKTGKEMWASPVVDASRGLLATSAGRMGRSKADEHDGYGDSPYQ